MKPFVPQEFSIPLRLEHPQFVLRPLLISDVVKDYDAVMTSLNELQNIFGPTSSWPSHQLSFEQDLIDLGWHHKEFQRRSSFAYTVTHPDGSLCLGCTYIYPTAVEGYDAEAYCWDRSSKAAELDACFTTPSGLGSRLRGLSSALPFRDANSIGSYGAQDGNSAVLPTRGQSANMPNSFRISAA